MADGLRLGDLFLLVRPRDPEVGGAVEVRPARAGALRVISPGSHPGTVQVIAAPGAPGCLPRLRFFAASRSAARRCLRGGLRPGVSSPEGGIEELPLLRDTARSSRAIRSFSSATWPAQARDLGVPRRQLLPQLRDLLIAGSARGATRGRRRHLGHER